jgi:hypothetical protein
VPPPKFISIIEEVIHDIPHLSKEEIIILFF